MVVVPHMAWPLRLTPGGQLMCVEQDTISDVRQCVHILVRTPRGARPLAPEVGVVDPAFTGGVEAAVLKGELQRWEERADVTVTATTTGGGQQVTVDVALHQEA